MATPLFGLVEAGGTKVALGIASGPDAILEEGRIETTTPDETLARSVDWVRAAAARHGAIKAVGVASFGPIELDRASPAWGALRATPKPGWSGADMVAPFREAFRAPVGFDTDVNAAALAEQRWGAGRDVRLAVYVTVGTGIGGGAVVDGRTLVGLSHPEMGHIPVARHPRDQDFAGSCRFHGVCLEGLASGPAISARWGATLSELPTDHVAHEIVAHYVAQMCTALQAMMEPGRILLGGGVMETPGLLGRVRESARTLQNGYFRGDPDTVIAAPALAPRSGLLGALALAQDALAAEAR
ncbi:MAG: ROK family protein [Hyphomonadaceae bacterium]|nr:ROK family protein [Hyphomonadaceae bacterium]